MVALPINIEFVFASHARNIRPTRVSDFLGIAASEPTFTPVYIVRQTLRLWGETWNALYVQLFFPTNPGYCCGRSGAHPADVERVVVLRDPQTLTPKWVYFSAHGNGQGTWRRWGHCLFGLTGALRVYVARESNAMYPEPGTYWRVLGVANDTADGKGPVFAPRAADFCDADAQTWAESHRQVAPGIRAPSDPAPPPARGAEPWERMLLVNPSVRQRIAAAPQAVQIS